MKKKLQQQRSRPEDETSGQEVRKTMDSVKTGELIYKLRTERNLTQKQMADQLHISDKTISKWERGLGFPDMSMLPALTELFGINAENLLRDRKSVV